MKKLFIGLIMLGIGYFLFPDFFELIVSLDLERIMEIPDNEFLMWWLKFTWFFSSIGYLAISPFDIIRQRRHNKRIRSELVTNAKHIGLKDFDSWSNEELAAAIDKTQREIEETQERRNEANEKARLIKLFGELEGERIYKHELWQGMTKAMLFESRGVPSESDETIFKKKTKAKCFYKPYRTRQKNTKYHFRIDLEDDIVVGWKDL
jgi:hypothetical protein